MPHLPKSCTEKTNPPVRNRTKNSNYILAGRAVTKPWEVQREYNSGVFYYQFHGVGPTSRVHVCDNEGELNWLVGQVKNGARLIVRPHPEGKKKQSISIRES